MRELRDLVRSPHHLLVFETAARCGSFTRAAKELNVSQPAVSLTIRQLEESLGIPLFQRGHRTITLTQAGELLYNDVSDGFLRILETVRRLQRQRGQSHVTLSVSTAFANYWMVPRLADLHRQHPGIDLRLQTTDKDLDLDQEGLSLGVRRGTGQWAGYDAVKIAADVLFPVASPNFLAKSGGLDSLDALAAERLIFLEEPFRPRPTWADWFQAQGFDYRDSGEGLRLNDYALVIQAAMAGEGVALGWQHIVVQLLRQRLLVPVGNWRWETGRDHYLLWSNRTPLSKPAEIVRDWIIDVAGAE